MKIKPEYQKALKEAQVAVDELKALTNKMETAAHNFAKSFANHPTGCIYCKEFNRRIKE